MKAEEWLKSVKTNPDSMSQRKVTTVARWEGGLEELTRLAKESGVHLLLLEDDKGDELVAASTRPFKVLC